MKVSIVIPMYNEERYISRCLNSLVKQSFKDFELILIDDGSSDKTIFEAEKFTNSLNLTILKQEHGGPGKARNWGAQVAKGEILIFVDADMYFDEKYIENLIKPITDGKDIGTGHGTELVGNIENKTARAYGLTRGRIFEDGERGGVFRAILKDEFLKYGGFDSSKGYFDDNLGKINGGKGSLFVKDAICYHNNPEKIGEIFNHSVWVGEGLMKSGEIKGYSIKYKNWILSFLVFLVISLIVSILKGFFFILPILSILILIVLIFIKAIQRSFKEKYLSHLIFVPPVIITRGIGYFVGILSFFIKK